MLLSAIDKHPYGFYNLLRIIVCITALYGIFKARNNNKINLMWIFGIVTFLFNPILPMHLTRDIWKYIDIITAIFLFISFFALKKSKK